ncbi:MAG TPA: hypothetical protein VJ377_01350 [Dehalococcoidales bacterium]|nr:hypothetical protein [Dehalococcoidales bacterium]
MKTLPAVSGEENPEKGINWILLAGVFLLSAGLLALEIAFTRLLSVVFSYHYLFLVVSLAMLGLGLGAVFVRFFNTRFPDADGGSFRLLSIFAGLFSLSVIFAAVAATFFTANLFLLAFLLFIPFFFAGMFLAGVFRAYPPSISKIYGADLIGAAAGSVIVILGLNAIGGPNTVLVIGIVLAFVSLLFVTGIRRNRVRVTWLPALGVIAAVFLLWVNLANPQLERLMLEADPTKEIHHALNTPRLGGEVIDTRWSAFGRTDVVAFRNDPSKMSLYIDATAGTPMYLFNGDPDNPSPGVQELKTFPGYLPLQALKDGEKDSALIIGPGGGRDILLALMGGVRRITAVEVNRDFVNVVRDYAAYNGGIYTDFDNVSVHVDEGRSFLRRQREKYDIIMLSLPVTRTGRSLEGYALTENFLFTTDSIKDYLEHLTDEGRLIVVAHDITEIFRLFSVSVTALEQLGIDSQAALGRMYALGADEYPLFVMKKSPLEPEETVALHRLIDQPGYNMRMSYIPSIGQGVSAGFEEETGFDENSMLNPIFTAIGDGNVSFNDLHLEHEGHHLDISPVTDDSPFFYNLVKGLPGNMPLVLWVSAGVLLSIILVSLRRKNRPAPPAGNSGMIIPAVFFSFLGIGFMLAEVSLFQRFTLFLGNPVLSMAVSLASLLVGAGLGSLYSGRLSPERLTRVISIVSLTVTLVLVVYAFSLPPLFRLLLGLELPIRLAASALLLALLGFFMGFPFPMGLRWLKETNRVDYIPWAWGINGLASVFGAVLAVAIAIGSGFTYALLTGAGLYLLLFLIFLVSWRKSTTVTHNVAASTTDTVAAG